MKLPLFQVALNSNSPMVMDQLVNVNNSQLAVNYPYYLSLAPGQTSLLRLRTGESFGRGTGVDHGVFLDYEHSWNHGDRMDGGATLSGIGRSDWRVGIHQFQRLDDRSTMYAQIDSPQAKSIQGSASYDRKFDGFSSNLSLSGNQYRIGDDYHSDHSAMLRLEKDPLKVGSLPYRMYYGAYALSQQAIFSSHKDPALSTNTSETPSGVYLRGASDSIRVDKRTGLTSTFELRQQSGREVKTPIGMFANVSMSRLASKTLTMRLSYDYARDGFSDNPLVHNGRHNLTFQTFYQSGQFNSSILMGKSLDALRAHIYSDLNYNFSKLWRTGFQYTYERWTPYTDFSYVIGYRIGWREVGLTWSKDSRRIGFQLLGASLN